MKIVLDSNIIFSALISGKELYLDIFRELQLVVPDFIFLEISKYEERIIKKTKVRNEFSFFVRELFSEITVVPKFGVSPESFQRAISLCQDIDPKDSPYLAVSIELDIPLWTNDKKLIAGLSKKGYKKVFTTDEILRLFIKR